MSRASTLKVRAQMLGRARVFFSERDILEIDCGALMKHAPIDSNIDCLHVGDAFLHTSPEYALKRLLSEGVGDCYFLGHVYRKEEIGALHNPEFTMAEWYRLGFTLSQMIQETCEFLFLFLGELSIHKISYRKAFETYAEIDYTKTPLEKLQALIKNKWSRTECLHYLLSHKIEPQLGKKELTILTDYPPYEAELAQTRLVNGEMVAGRFEVYYEGVELANGYHELAESGELKNRFEKTNSARIKEGKAFYLLDEKFLASLKTLPDCCGVALGFDRALMLHMKLKSIKQVIPFAWEEL